ncbi:PLP-dependent transferase [bacterium]|nr:MAG: PLP-dependent transferase [bacterium]
MAHDHGRWRTIARRRPVRISAMHGGEMDYGNAIETRLAHFGEDEKLDGAVVPPLFQNSLFVFDRTEDLHYALKENTHGKPFHYSRVGNPTLDLLERKLADLEGMESGRIFPSGMSAMAFGAMGCVQAGSHAVIVDGVYGPLRALFEQYLSRFGVTYTFVDGRSFEAVADAVRPETTLIYMESPTSLTFRLQDVEAITKLAKEKGIATMIDSTYNTPLHFQGSKYGIDIVGHSLTKYVSGHSDVTGGALLFCEERLRRYVHNEGVLFGATAAPFAAWLMTRGLRTMKLRLKQHEINANEVAAWLEGQSQVEQVHHIGLESYAQRDLFRKDYSGSGGIFAFVPKAQEKERVFAFCDALRLFGRGISWGGFESLVTCSQVQAIEMTEPVWYIRLFIGLEDVGDLIADLTQALPHLDG